eukprot:scaffold27077_cov123-Skeletonema_menzelii.AAC.1
MIYVNTLIYVGHPDDENVGNKVRRFHNIMNYWLQIVLCPHNDDADDDVMSVQFADHGIVWDDMQLSSA